MKSDRRTGRAAVMILTAVVSLMWAAVAPAEPVSQDDARRAAQGWLTEGRARLGHDLAADIGAITSCSQDSGAVLYYAVALNPDGFLIVSFDTTLEPVIAFAGHGKLNSSENSPLVHLLRRDLENRRQVTGNLQQKLALHKAGAMSMDEAELSAIENLVDGNREKWAGYLGQRGALAPKGANEISDVRIAPLVQSKWSQDISTNSDGFVTNCYNIYTPSNAVCGCVATAFAQILRYFQYPTRGIGVKTNEIYIVQNNITNPVSAKTLGGDGLGGAYDWTMMTLIPASNAYVAANWQMISRLTADFGVAVQMEYKIGIESGADMNNAAIAMTNWFYYGNSSFCGSTNSGDYLPAINSSLKAHLPVGLGINQSGSSGGHAIICDGFGYSASALYHHLNLGWEGSDDAWYNLPVIGTSNGSYNTIDATVYNIFTNGTGQIISGRITDANGSGLANATVSVQFAGGTVTAISDTKGYYGVVGITPNSTSLVTAALAGYVSAATRVTVGQSTELICGNTDGVDFVLTSSAPLAADFDNDGKADFAVVDANGYWTIWWSTADYTPYRSAAPLYVAGGTPVAADFDNDHKADMAMVAPDGYWTIWWSTADYTPYRSAAPLYVAGGTPVAADFDNDHKADMAMVGPNGIWTIWWSTADYTPYSSAAPLYGEGGVPVAADFDKDGKADMAMVAPDGIWTIWWSTADYAPFSSAAPLYVAG
ncbi:MAG: C10 family peptidase, partial [Kiritimatiellaeota bacterium]|nr:C10 family peptidase [Kiritimatiellota bacterium]